MLANGAAYFAAVREAIRKAETSVVIIGWDINSRTPLVDGSGETNDGYPSSLRSFLSALAVERPHLSIRLLLWDYAVLYSMEREAFPTFALQWNTPDNVQLCLDNHVPFGASQHQKIVVIDDAVAFCGGLDLTIRRWDTSEHAFDNSLRVDPSGDAYDPYHDVQAIVDGEAAGVLAELARDRRVRAASETLPRVCEPTRDPWPAFISPEFGNVEVGIARTQPKMPGQEEVREVVETLSRRHQ